MKRLYKYLIVIALVCSSVFAKAQNDGIGLTLLPQMPYVNYYNPGISVPYRGMVGVAFSNINVSMFNSSIKYNNIFVDNGTTIDAVKFANSLSDNNVVNTNFSMDLVNVGFRVKKLFFNIDWRLRMVVRFNFSKDFVGFFAYGNAHYLGADNPCDFNIGINASLFEEIGISAQYAVNDKLTIGIRPKILSGIANAVLENKETKIYTDANTFAMSADVDLHVKMASLLEGDISKFEDIGKMLDSTNANDFLDFEENLGFGVDFGASYVFNERFGVAAGVYDLGFIRWTDVKTKPVQQSNISLGEALFTDYNDIATFNLDNYQTMLEDIVDEVWGNEDLERGPDYKTYLQTRLMVQGYYELHPMVRFTGVGQLYFDKGKVHPAFTLAYSGNFWNHINLTLNYTLSKYTGSGLGMGLGFHFGPFNMYAVTDNILAVTRANSPIAEFASAYQQVNARFGIVWTW